MRIPRRATALLAAVAALASLIAGCAAPIRRADGAAAAAGFERLQVAGDPYTHVVYFGPGAPGASTVWIYIEGDGVPWTNGVVPAADPTPRSLVALEMMRRGPRPAIYLGRPCYFGTAGTPPCTPADWTHGRFGPAVVRSMRTGLERALALRAPGFTRINLVGYSGGGALATLLAPGTREACALVTVASPLDIDEWARLRSYAPLRGSENPARLFPLPARLSQLHLRGAKDVEVAPDNAATALGGNPGARVHLVAAAGHDFDWPGVWVDLLTGREPGFPETCR